MITYFDSNIILSVLLNDANAEKAADSWEATHQRLGSILVEAECLVVLRRAQKGYKKSTEWLEHREKLLENYIDNITLKYLDDEVIKVIRQEDRLSNCRSLDAIHLATALIWQDAVGMPIYFCSFDERINRTAKEFGFIMA